MGLWVSLANRMQPLPCPTEWACVPLLCPAGLLLPWELRLLVLDAAAMKACGETREMPAALLVLCCLSWSKLSQRDSPENANSL